MMTFSGVDKVTNQLQDIMQRKQEAIKNVINSILAEMVAAAKTDASGFNDRTGNLRNSIGYVPAFEGTMEDVVSSVATITNKKGPATQQVTFSAKSRPSTTITGIIFAGMEYGVYVEYDDGHFVIGGAWSEYIDKFRELFIERMNGLGL